LLDRLREPAPTGYYPIGDQHAFHGWLNRQDAKKVGANSVT
jgi:hypothetical protein